MRKGWRRAAGLMAAPALLLAVAPPSVLAQGGTVSITFKNGSVRAAGGGAGRGSRGGISRGRRTQKQPTRLAGAQTRATPADAAPHLVPNGERLDNAEVLKLNQLGLGDPAIIAKIHASEPHFEVSTDTLIALRRAGISSAVIAAMIEMQSSAVSTEVRPDSPDPHAPHPAGVYVLAGWLPEPKMLAMRPTTTTRTTSGSILGYAFSGGLASVNYRAILPSEHAGIVAGEARPTFYFFTGSATASQSLVSNWGAPPAPEEIALVRFDQTKNGREVRIGTFNIHGASTGISPQDSIPISSGTVAPGVEVVRPDADLPPGEYGFIQTAGGVGVGGAQVATSTARVFDFAVGPAAQGSHEGALGNPVGEAAAGGSNATAAALLESALYAAARGSTSRTARVKLPKEPNSAPSLYPGGK